MSRLILSVFAVAALLATAAGGDARSEDSRDFLLWRKSLGPLKEKGGPSAQTQNGGSLSAPTGGGIPVIEGGGSLKQPCGMGHLGCLDGDPPSGKGFNPKK